MQANARTACMMQACSLDAHMLGKTYPGQDCSAARTLELVGERWTLLILRDAMFRNYVRYSQFAESLGIATNVLAKRLDGLVASGLMEARGTGPRADHREYHLTAMGMELKPVVIALTAWGDKWLSPGPVIFRHGSDGGSVVLETRCTKCGDVVNPADIVARRRPVPPAPKS